MSPGLRTPLLGALPGRSAAGALASAPNGCVPAGTVVDSVICHPTEHDFFLQVRSVPKSFSHPLVTTFDRVPFRLTDELSLHETVLSRTRGYKARRARCTTTSSRTRTTSARMRSSG